MLLQEVRVPWPGRPLDEPIDSRWIAQPPTTFLAIMDAPRLELGPDERVTIPLLNNNESRRHDAWAGAGAPRGCGVGHQ